MIRTKQGFTLIELLIVVVIIGILAAIAIPKFSNTKEKAYVSEMQSDLRNLNTAQENYFGDNNKYTTVLADLSVTASSGVNVTITAAAPTVGWQAKADRAGTTRTCTIWVNDKGSMTGAEAVPICTTGATP